LNLLHALNMKFNACCARWWFIEGNIWDV